MPPVIAICGIKNSGKTTVMCGVIPLLRRHGLKVTAIKHDGHDFTPDVPETDSFRFREAGAAAVAVFSSQRFLLTVEQPQTNIDIVFKHIQHIDADLILLEGGKASAYPKIEVVRKGISSELICDPATLLAICTDTDLVSPGVVSVALTDYQALADIIIRHTLVRKESSIK